MDATPVAQLRRRTSSFACTENASLSQTDTTPISPFDAIEAAPVKSNTTTTRFRRSSFALTGERQTTLDGLVSSASQHVTQAAANQEAVTLTSLVTHPPAESTSVHANPCHPSPPTNSGSEGSTDVDARRVSMATVTPKSARLSLVHNAQAESYSNSSCSGSDCGAAELSKPLASGFAVSALPQTPFVWHNTELFQSNPLKSELLLKYLAALAIDNTVPTPSPSLAPPGKHQLVVTENIPGIVPTSAIRIASMTMPVQRKVRNAYKTSDSSAKLSSSYDPACSPIRQQYQQQQHHGWDRDGVMTDYSSVWSDSESWYGGRHHQGGGYLSESFDTVPPRRFEKDFPLPTSALARSRHSRSAANTPLLPLVPGVSRGKSADRSHLFEPASPPSIPSKFDVTRVYDGLSLPVPGPHESKRSRSIVNLAAADCPSPNAQSVHSHVSSTRSLTRSHAGLQRLRQWFDQALKPQLAGDSGQDGYIYPDEEALARRAKAQASNVISPVSF